MATILQLVAAAMIALPILGLAFAALQIETALRSLPEQIGNGPGADPARTAALESDLAAIRRDLNDVDERAEARYRRLTSRARRAEGAPGAGDEPADMDPRQLAMYGLREAAATPPSPGTPSRSPNGRPRLMRAPGR